MNHSPKTGTSNAMALDPRVMRLAEALAEFLSDPAARGDAPDELVAINDSDIERAALKRLIRNKELPARRLGRKLYVRRSDLLALVPKTSPEKKIAPVHTSPEVAYLDAVRQAKARAR